MTDESTLNEFAATGFAWFRQSGIGLDELAEWCNQRGIELGDHRFWILGATFFSLDEWWASKDHQGGITTDEYIVLNEAVRTELAAVLAEHDQAVAASLASQFALKVQAVMDGRIPKTLYSHEDDVVFE